MAQTHKTSKHSGEPLIQTTFPPSPLSHPYPKLIGTMTLSILLPPMMNQWPQMMLIGTLLMNTCICVLDSPLPQSSSHPRMALASISSCQDISVGRLLYHPASLCCSHEQVALYHAVGHSSAPMPVTRTIISLDMHGTPLKGIPFSTQIQVHLVQSPFTPCMCTLCLIGPPPLDSDVSPGYKPDALNYTLYEDAWDVLLHHPPWTAALMHGGIGKASALWELCQMMQSVGLSHDIFLKDLFLSLADGYLWIHIVRGMSLEVVWVHNIRCTQVCFFCEVSFHVHLL